MLYIVEIGEHESLFHVKSTGDYVLGVLIRQSTELDDDQ